MIAVLLLTITIASAYVCVLGGVAYERTGLDRSASSTARPDAASPSS